MSHKTIALVGNPNCGKTTIFNALTGSKQHVGNWPGVTVERKSGFFKSGTTNVEVIDLPGTYSLTIVSDSASIDEKIACDYILSRQADVIVNVLDASNLERSLYLTTQLLEMHVPVVLAVNMMDIARQNGMQISLSILEQMIGCPVISLEANRNKGIEELQQTVIKVVPMATDIFYRYPTALTTAIDNIAALLTAPATLAPRWLATRLLEDDVYVRQFVANDVLQSIPVRQQEIKTQAGEDADILLADARYRFIGTVLAKVLHQNQQERHSVTEYLDRIVLNRWLGIPIFLAVMYFMFLFAINVGGAFQDFFDISSSTIFVGGVGAILTQLNVPTWLIAILANGIGKGINTTLTFIPVIGALFLSLAFLEDSGYMARAAFVIDRLMRALGLPGKSFVPMIIGFGCNVPAVMAARTLENKRDRILTIMMSPFMSCGARLAIYAVFVAAFFPVGGQNIIFALYMIGIMAAMLTGLLLRKTFLKGEPAPLLMELPSYHVPHLKTIGLHAWQRLQGFVFRAGKLIIPICMLLGVLNSLTLGGTMLSGDGDVHSLLSWLGRAVTPIFAPMGIHQDNWPATVGLLTGVLAKEVVIGTLNSLYSQLGYIADLHASGFSFWGGMHDAWMSIPANLAELGGAFGNPLLASAPVSDLSQPVYAVMYEHFGGQVNAMAYLLFVLLYFPCVSTTAAMLRELHRGWVVFSVLWTTGLAYCVAVGFYQLATLMQHPLESLLWTAGIAIVFFFTTWMVRYLAAQELRRSRYEFAGH